VHEKKSFYGSMMFQLVVAIAVGALIGLPLHHMQHSGGLSADSLKTIADWLRFFPTAFIHLVKMIVGLIIFCTLVVAVAKMGDGKEVGRIGLCAIIFFEVVSTLALLFGLLLGNLFHPGAGAQLNVSLGASLPTETVKLHTPIEFLLDIIPQTALGALTQNNLLQVLMISLLLGFALAAMREKAKPILDLLHDLTEAVFIVVGMIMKTAPLAVFGAVSSTLVEYGFEAFKSLGALVGMVYLGCIVFTVVAFGAIAWWSGFGLWKFILYIRDEIILVYGTASSEAALPRLIAKLEKAGCSPSSVAFVVPAGYSFNLVGSSLYLTLSALFIAQATNHPLPLAAQWGLLGFFLLTSKGMAGVTGASFVVLSSALSAFQISDSWLPLILAVDRFMDMMRSTTNLIGNGVSALAIAKLVGERNDRQMHNALDGKAVEEIESSQVIRGEDSAETEVPAFLG
jgi:aerobic C4-dicarboxylate transport protein